MAAEYRIQLKNKKEVARETMSFYFSKPEGFDYKAGQSMDLTLIDPPETDAEGNTRTFTIAAPPYEEHLMITTRLRDTAYKRTLSKMSFSTALKMSGPYGSFILPNNSTVPVVFITGGIGVTPAHSIIFNATKNLLRHKLYLFYANRTPEDTAFLNDFQEIQILNPHFVFIPTMTKADKSVQKWEGENGYIDKNMLQRHISKDIKSVLYYLSGPMRMVSAMQKMLNEAGINEDNIRTEEFPGY